MINNRAYYFETVWLVEFPLDIVWSELSAKPFNWDKWWPEMTNVRDLIMTKHLVGSRFSCTWRSPVGYRLNTHIAIAEVKPRETVKLEAKGDLVGSVICTLKRDGEQTRINISWQVDTKRRWMNVLQPILKPVFVASHHHVMKSGLKGLNQYLAR